MRRTVRTTFILLGAGTLFYLLRKYSYLIGFLYGYEIIELLIFLGSILFAFWAVLKVDALVSKSRFHLPVQSAAIMMMTLFFGYQMFASHFYSEQHLREIGLEKVEQLFELSELAGMDMDAAELRERAEEITVKETAYAISLYGTNPWPPPGKSLEVLEFERRYHAYNLVLGNGVEGEQARYTLTRDGLDFKISGYSSE